MYYRFLITYGILLPNGTYLFVKLSGYNITKPFFHRNEACSILNCYCLFVVLGVIAVVVVVLVVFHSMSSARLFCLVLL